MRQSILSRRLAVVALLAVAAAMALAQAAGSTPVSDDEFVGPFPGWTNLKTAYRAAGDGAADETAAIQQALDELGTPGHSPVLFIPRGTYRITKTLVLASTINLSIVGEDPAATTIVWDGGEGGTMLSINGVAYSRVSRLVFDGRKRASVAVEQSWDNTRPHFDTGNEYADDTFADVEYGIHGGFKGHGFAETSIRRSHFTRNTKAGVALGNFNALDIWVWYSTFEDCAAGITNTTGAGNFHVYNSVFRRSTVADLSMGNTGGFSARGNYSIGSKAFFTGSGTNNPATITIQGNTIVDPLDSTVIGFGNQGPGWMVDNVIKSLPAATGPVVSWASFLNADLTSIGNTFTSAAPLRSNGRLTSIDDRVVDRSEITSSEPVLPGPPPNLRRQVFEVPAGSDAAAVQAVVAAAAGQNGNRPIVHLSHGTYQIAETITIPAGDMQIVGDGFGTVLRWTGSGAGPVVRLIGPSKATLREIQVDGAGMADGIAIESVDQVGSRVYMDQAQLRGGKRTDLFVNGLDHANVQLEDAGYAYSPEAVSIKVVGGPLLAAGRPAGGKIDIFSGASSGHRTSYDVSGGASVLVRDVWYESGAGPGFARIHDRAVFTVDGSRLSTPAGGTPPAFDIQNLNGRVTIVATHIDDRISVSGDGSKAMVLGLGVFAEQRWSSYFLNAASPPARAALFNTRQHSLLPGTRSASTANIGSADPAFIRTMLSHARRESPRPLVALPAGVTDVRLFRVWVSNGTNNITLTAGPVQK
jgi:hypothetical protein